MTNEDTNCKVTIGMPVYNVVDYIRESLVSALEQDIDDVEILIIDDCGTDSSMDIVRSLAASHPNGSRIRIVKHEKNKGVAEARNTILNEARGKYIFFLDSDDIITHTALSTLYKKAEEEGAELTYGSAMVREQDEGKEFIYFSLPQLTLSGQDALVNYIYGNLRQNIPYCVWNILYLSSFIKENDIRFPSFRTGEDIMFNELIQPKVRKAVLSSEITYTYRKRANSLMRFQAREQIDIEEVRSSLKYSELQKRLCLQLRDKPYFAGKCAKTMKAVFYRVCGVLKHRHQLTEDVTDQELHSVLRHPVTFNEILRFKHYKGTNIAFWILGALPPSASIRIVKFIGSKKGLIS